MLKTEDRPEKLWVPQGTLAQKETDLYNEYFPRTSRFNSIIVQSIDKDNTNILTKDLLIEAMKMHTSIESGISTTDKTPYTLVDLCTKNGGSCVNSGTEGICQCLVTSILREWNYDLETLENDTDILATVNGYGSKEDLEGMLGVAVFDDSGAVLSAEAFSLSYFLIDRSIEDDANTEDPINEDWEDKVFLETVQSKDYPKLSLDYFAGRSFGDEFGGAISGDLVFVQISYIIAFVFLGATLGSFRCGPGSRWSMAIAALFLVALSTGAGLGLSSYFGLFYTPIHALLPFILLGIGVDDVFVIVNAFNRERNGPRRDEDDKQLIKRSTKALSRAGASITVTSLTDLVAFAISSSSALPALASFCAYAAICILFLWVFAATFFTATLVQDEKRQRDNRKDILCCVTRKQEQAEEGGFEEGRLSIYFRKYHAPIILSKAGKALVLLAFSGLFAYGVYGAMNLSVEDSSRSFIPQGSYVQGYFDSQDEYFPISGVTLYVTFENGEEVYAKRSELAKLELRLTGLSEDPPYIAEPNTEETYKNVMSGLSEYLATQGTSEIGGVQLGDDNWPTNYADFVTTLKEYSDFTGPGAQYARALSFSEDESTSLNAFHVELTYVTLTKQQRGKTIDDSDKLIDAMDETRKIVENWDNLPSRFTFSENFRSIEGFKVIRVELFRNVGLAVAAVGVICLVTVGSPVTAFLITINVALCLVEILGFMYAVGIVIDSISVINIVLAVGLSVDYSAHVGHCFMVKGGDSKDKRATEALADIGASVLNGATSTFLAVAILLFSSSYVFQTLSVQFALTVALGLLHGLVLLPVLLTLVGPKPYSSAKSLDDDQQDTTKDVDSGDDVLASE